MPKDSHEIRCILDAQATIGECPVWSAEEQALYWVDILAPALFRLDPATGEQRRWDLPEAVGSFGLGRNGDAVLALRTGFHRLDLKSGALSFLVQPEGDRPGNRFNDGKVSPDGRFFAGTMDEERMSRPQGALYRLDPGGSCTRVIDGLIVSNGLAWSADGRTMFHSDSKGQVIWAWSYDPRTGAIADRREVARPSETIGRPDGAATDAEGFYWSAGISAGVLNRWSPEGRLDRQIALPCVAPTCPCFGGPDLRTLYVTSLRHHVAPERLAERPLSGGIFALRVDVPGVPVARFGG